MAFTYGFFNSLRGDRKYNAEQVSEIFDGILADGIIPTVPGLFAVTTANNGMQINVAKGRAWFDHTWSKNDSTMILTVPESDITRPRYDAVVLEVNHEQEVRANAIKIVSGVPEVNTTKPILINNDKVHQYPLAYILVPAGSTTVAAENIENMVGRTPTPFATGILETAPLDELWAQWEGQWNTWFSAIKLQLSGDIVTNLQYQIDQLGERVDLNRTDIDWLIERSDLIANGLAKVTLHLKDEYGDPLSGWTITGLRTKSGSSVSTDTNGFANAYINSGSRTIQIKKYDDITSYTNTMSFIAGEKYNFNITLNYIHFIQINATKDLVFSGKFKNINFTIVGGGGGGGGADSSYGVGSGGGGGGGLSKGSGIIVKDSAYTATIGAGGSGGLCGNYGDFGTCGASGGTSSFMGVSANGGEGGKIATQQNAATVAGGSGGTGNVKSGGSGGRGGSSDSNRPTGGGAGPTGHYSSLTETCAVSGGGGGGGYSFGSSNSPTSGGSPNGGSGGYYKTDVVTPYAPTSGIRPGGGGGGSARYYAGDTPENNGGSGGGGQLSIRLS